MSLTPRVGSPERLVSCPLTPLQLISITRTQRAQAEGRGAECLALGGRKRDKDLGRREKVGVKRDTDEEPGLERCNKEIANEE